MSKSSLVLLSLLLFAHAALAEPPGSPRDAAIALVSKQLLQPLKKLESRRSKFSRSAAPPSERRLRMLDDVAQTDARGRQFLRFAIDAHHYGDEDEGDGWQLDAMRGCVYLDQKDVFIQSDDEYLPARALLGKDADAITDAQSEPDVECDARPVRDGSAGRLGRDLRRRWLDPG